MTQRVVKSRFRIVPEMDPRERQRRGRRIAMTPGERDEFLASHLTCRVATINADGSPHVTPVWFYWDGAAVWIYSITRSQRWTNLQRDPRVAVVMDDGDEYFQLRGVEFRGEAEFVGEQPRVGEPVAELEEVERRFAKRNSWEREWIYDQRHAWIRVRPAKEVSWDFRKLGDATAAFPAIGKPEGS
jgi:PPOX class probable F420-dependent enzyme